MPRTRIQTLPLSLPRGLVALSLTAFTRALARRSDRQRLAQLDAHLLRDIGLDAQDALRECEKPFWQA